MLPYNPNGLPMPGGQSPFFNAESWRNGCNQQSAFQARTHSITFDATTQTWGEMVIVNGSPRRWKALLGDFVIIDVIRVLASDHSLRCYIVRYRVNGEERIAVIRAGDYANGRIFQCFEGITRLPDCSMRKASDTIAFLIEQYHARELIVLERQGFQTLPNGTVMFGFCPAGDSLPPGILSSSLQKRKLNTQPVNLDELFSNWRNLYQNHPVLLFIGLFRIAALILFFLQREGVRPVFLFIFIPSDAVNRKKLCALLNTNCPESPVPQLNWSVPQLRNAVFEIVDGVAFIEDPTFPDEGPAIDGPLRFLLQKEENDGIGRNLTAVVSEHAAYQAYQIAPDRIKTISLEGVTLNAEPQVISDLTIAVDSVIINWILKNPLLTQTLVHKCIEIIRENDNDTSDPDNALYCALICAEALLQQVAGEGLADKDHFDDMWNGLSENQNSIQSSNEIINRDFGQQLSKRFRTGDYSAVSKCKGLRIDPESKTAIVTGSRVLISGEMMREIQRDMSSTRSQKGLIRALRHNDLLNTTDGDTRPIEIHDLQGAHRRLYWYDISQDVLDVDVIHQLQNLETAEFWLRPEEIPRNFLPLLQDGQGRIAGKLICSQDVENEHSYTSGQSGIGKSTKGHQSVAYRHKLGRREIVMEAGDSFSEESMIRNLSRQFVQDEVLFYDLDSKGLPVNPFLTDRNAPLATQQRQLLNVLSVALGELSAPQTNLLRTIVADQLCKGECIDLDDIIALLPKDNASADALRSRLKPLANELSLCGMRNGNWDDFLKGEQRILVFHTDSACAEHGSQLIDILLCTLLEYQRGNAKIPVDIFIDELQNQNFSAGSPIRRILREGRKYGIAFHGLTQDFFPRNTELGGVMGKADSLVFMKPTQNSAELVAKELRWGKADLERFDSMDRGDAVIKASFYSKEKKRNIPTTLSGKIATFNNTTSAVASQEDTAKIGGENDEKK